MGKVLAICISEKKGTLKTEINECKFIEDFGLENDAHAGKWHRQVSLIEFNKIDEFRKKGANVDFGAFGENLVIEGIELTQSHIQTILYIAYGVRLATKNERLTLEHPQMWQCGPVFPRAYNRIRKDASDGTDEYYSLKTAHPNIFKYLENCFRRYAWTKACVLTTPHLSEGTPWSQTRKSNPDRWGVRIEDELIREWFLPRV